MEKTLTAREGGQGYCREHAGSTGGIHGEHWGYTPRGTGGMRGALGDTRALQESARSAQCRPTGVCGEAERYTPGGAEGAPEAWGVRAGVCGGWGNLPGYGVQEPCRCRCAVPEPGECCGYR